MTKNYLAPNVNSAEVEKSCFIVKRTLSNNREVEIEIEMIETEVEINR